MSEKGIDMTPEEKEARIQELRTELNDVSSELKSTQEEVQSFDDTGRALRPHENEQRNSAARRVHRLRNRYAEITMELDGLEEKPAT